MSPTEAYFAAVLADLKRADSALSRALGRLASPGEAARATSPTVSRIEEIAGLSAEQHAEAERLFNEQRALEEALASGVELRPGPRILISWVEQPTPSGRMGRYCVHTVTFP